MPLNHDKLVARVAELRSQRDQALSQANFIAGALKQAEDLLAEWDAPAEVTSKPATEPQPLPKRRVNGAATADAH